MHRLIFSLLILLLAGPAVAGELSVLGGLGWKDNPAESTAAWQIQYLEGLGEHFGYSLSYLNQGHFRINHRDCHAVNLWTRANLFDRRLSLAAGLGGLFYYDTVTSPGDGRPRVNHGWGTVVSLAANWYTAGPWFYQLQGYGVRAGGSFDTLSALAGIGYQFNAPASPGPEISAPSSRGKTTANELTAFAGEAIVNHPESEHSHAGAIEYRHGLWRHLEWTVRALYEGRNILTDRYGVTSQLWLAKPFLNERITLGAGFGGYWAYDKRRGDFEPGRTNEGFLNGIASMSVSYRTDSKWNVRAIWDRVITDYDRDADVLLLGLGYRF